MADWTTDAVDTLENVVDTVRDKTVVPAQKATKAVVFGLLVAFFVLTALLMLVGVIVVQQIEAHILQPFLMGRWVSVHPLAVILAPIAGAAVYDFFFYWFHRAQHRWFWRYHAVHHSVRELNAVNAYHHITEPFFQAVFLLLPASLFGSDTGYLAPAMAVVLHLHSSFIHSPTSIDLCRLRLFFCDNRFHRIHHSIEERHFDRNFGAFTTLWDRLFGTAHFPAAQEWPDVGLAEVDQPRGLIAWAMMPYRLRRESDPPRASIAPANI